ncbi:MAG: deaminase [Candidatus Pacebacteria bacterium]|nr:deaminase [Candidatus Paceibacterota bacterium]
MSKVIIAYVPVLHEGYRHLFESHKDVDKIYIFGKDLIKEFDYLAKEIRALDPELIKKSLDGWDIPEVSVLNKDNINEVTSLDVVMPDEDICRQFADRYIKGNVTFDPIFLRWDRTNTQREKKVGPEKIITENEFINKAFKEAEKSSDWWRKVGAVAVKNGKVILSKFNKQVPSQHMPYAVGDPRNASHKGQDLDLFTSIHAEAGIIAEAAKEGISLSGCDMYVTDFPCPVCAKQIAYSGIKRLYFHKGYAVLDGESILKSNGIEIIQVK